MLLRIFSYIMAHVHTLLGIYKGKELLIIGCASIQADNVQLFSKVKRLC